MGHRWTMAEVLSLPGQQGKAVIQETRRVKRRPVTRSALTGPRSHATADGWFLVYSGKLPRMNVQSPDWRKRWQLKQACLRQFGILPQPATQIATVVITRVLGPRERLLDPDNFSYACKGAMDSLTNRRPKKNGRGYTGGGNWIIDDSPRYVQVSYVQDATRRHEGPCMEIIVRYQP